MTPMMPERDEDLPYGDATDELVAVLREAPRSEGQITSIGKADADDEDAWRWYLYTDVAAVARCESAGDARHIMECWNAVPTLVAALKRAASSVCSLTCPVVWRTADGPPPHSSDCQAITAALALAEGVKGEAK